MKGQSALEFLTTYGWALVMILIIIGSLTYFGVLDPSIAPTTRCEVFPEFTCDAVQIHDDGRILIELRNNLGKLDILNVSIESQDCTIDEGFHTQNNMNQNVLVNDSLLRFSCSETLDPGASFEAELILDYVPNERVIPQQKRGIIKGIVINN